MIGIEDFSKVEIKTGQIISAENVEGSNRLLLTKVDLGNGDIRQIVAGIAKFYEPNDILNKHILVASNLKPATIMGVESQGMLLSVKKGKKLKLVEVNEELPLGKKLV